MSKKPKISVNGTYIFDADALVELDELTLTTVIRDATASVAAVKEGEAQPQPAVPTHDEQSYVDSTINALLQEISPTTGETDSTRDGTSSDSALSETSNRSRTGHDPTE